MLFETSTFKLCFAMFDAFKQTSIYMFIHTPPFPSFIRGGEENLYFTYPKN